MIIAGKIANGMTQLITQTGERVRSSVRPQKTYIGVSFEMFSAKRLWVDDALTDAERVLFIKNQFSDVAFYSVDYEVIDRDAGRVLLHAYALHQNYLFKKATAVETVLHGLGRALRHMHDCGGTYQCVSIFEQYIVLSVHRDDCIYFFVKEYFKQSKEVIYAIRRAMERYYASRPIAVDQCFFVNFTQDKELAVCAEVDFAATVTWIDEEAKEWLIAYGLACRGLVHD